jgi:ABC-type transport system involved in cytochrome c biogenesis permease component
VCLKFDGQKAEFFLVFSLTVDAHSALPFGVSPRSTERAAPAVFCSIFDLAGMSGSCEL